MRKAGKELDSQLDARRARACGVPPRLWQSADRNRSAAEIANGNPPLLGQPAAFRLHLSGIGPRHGERFFPPQDLNGGRHFFKSY